MQLTHDQIEAVAQWIKEQDEITPEKFIKDWKKPIIIETEIDIPKYQKSET